MTSLGSAAPHQPPPPHPTPASGRRDRVPRDVVHGGRQVGPEEVDIAERGGRLGRELERDEPDHPAGKDAQPAPLATTDPVDRDEAGEDLEVRGQGDPEWRAICQQHRDQRLHLADREGQQDGQGEHRRRPAETIAQAFPAEWPADPSHQTHPPRARQSCELPRTGPSSNGHHEAGV